MKAAEEFGDHFITSGCKRKHVSIFYDIRPKQKDICVFQVSALKKN